MTATTLLTRSNDTAAPFQVTAENIDMLHGLPGITEVEDTSSAIYPRAVRIHVGAGKPGWLVLAGSWIEEIEPGMWRQMPYGWRPADA